MNSPTHHAIGALKLVSLHLDHPYVVPEHVMRGAAAEAIERLSCNTPHATQLVQLYTQLLAILPVDYLPYVTLTTQPATPYGAVIATTAGKLVLTQVGKTVEGVVAMIGARFSEGRGE